MKRRGEGRQGLHDWTLGDDQTTKGRWIVKGAHVTPPILGQNSTSQFILNYTGSALSLPLRVFPHLMFNLCIITAATVTGGLLTKAKNLIQDTDLV